MNGERWSELALSCLALVGWQSNLFSSSDGGAIESIIVLFAAKKRYCRHNMSFLHSPALRSENTTNIVTIDLSNHPPNAKLGMLLAPGSLPTPLNNGSDGSSISSSAAAAAAIPTASNVTLVAGWEHGTNQPLGPIQRSGMVRLGDRLVRINGRDVTDWTFREVMDVLKEMITITNNNSNYISHQQI